MAAAGTRTSAMDAATLQDEASFAAFVTAFEAGKLPRERWTHGAHVAIGALYLRRYAYGVLPKVRTAIRRHNRSVGTPAGAYHETLTIFWLAVVDNFLRGAECATDLEAVRAAVAEFGEQRRLHADYYGFDVVKSDPARGRWMKPDLKPLEVRFILTAY